ncbi:MAG: PKD domain-containing protein [Candidatus Omnitrophica bacterium]|nr:PKD domain-containing protein [Candidatus Omnitrophota bacterium]
MDKRRVFLVVLFLVTVSFLFMPLRAGFCAEQKKVTIPQQIQAQPSPQSTPPQVPTTQRVPEGPRVPIQDEPTIREFSIEPTTVLPNNRIVINWRVESEMSKISEVRISSPSLGINLRSSNASGNYTYTIPGSVGLGRYQVSLTATNEAGRTTAPRLIDLNVVGELGLRVTRLWAEPEEFADGQNVELNIGSNTNSGEDIRDLMVFIFHEGREVARLGPIWIGRGGMMRRSIPNFSARPGTYVVELRSGERGSRSEFRTESLTRYKFLR